MNQELQEKKKQRQTKTTRLDDINEDMTLLKLTLRAAVDLTNNRRQWRVFISTHRPQMTHFLNLTDLYAYLEVSSVFPLYLDHSRPIQLLCLLWQPDLNLLRTAHLI